MRVHWTAGSSRRTGDGGKLYWRAACGRWLRLHQCAAWGPQVTCKHCRTYMDRLAAGEGTDGA